MTIEREHQSMHAYPQITLNSLTRWIMKGAIEDQLADPRIIALYLALPLEVVEYWLDEDEDHLLPEYADKLMKWIGFSDLVREAEMLLGEGVIDEEARQYRGGETDHEFDRELSRPFRGRSRDMIENTLTEPLSTRCFTHDTRNNGDTNE